VTTVKKLLMIAVLVTLAAEAHAETSVLRSLPTATQKQIENIRAECRGADLTTTSGDEGLSPFTLSGAQAVMVDGLNFCDGGQCNHGINCATGYSHSLEVYVRSGNAWRKALSTNATEPVFLSVEPYTEKFRALVLSVHGGDEGCPVRNKNDPTAWKREKCDFVVKWDGTKFVWKPL
jgi:hypothetical protein